MPNLKLTLFIILLPVICYAQQVNIDIIAMIESNHNAYAYNEKTQARGLCQITPICLKEYVERKGLIYIAPDALFDPVLNKEIAQWYLNNRIPYMLKWFNKPVTIDNILWAYNAGIGMVVKGIMPNETKRYIRDYKALNTESQARACASTHFKNKSLGLGEAHN